MKITDTALAKYYGVSRETLRNYKTGKGGIGKERLYEAMRDYYEKLHEAKEKQN